MNLITGSDLTTVKLDNDGQLRTYVINDSECLQVDNQFSNQNTLRTHLNDDELPGNVQLLLGEQWQPLPSLTPRG